MRFVTSSVVIALAAAATVGPATGCRPTDDDDDDIPPRVLGVDPSTPVVPVSARFRVTFSEELNDKTVGSDPTSDDLSVVLAPRFNGSGDLLLNDAFLSDLDNPPLSESRQDDLVAVDVALVDGDTALEVTPRAALLPGTAYTLVIGSEIRDTAGNPIVNAAGVKATFLWEFSTDAGPPVVKSSDIGPSGVVVPNRQRIRVSFNQAVLGVDNDTLLIEGTPAPRVEAILLDEGAATATLVLGELDVLGGCERLGPGASYTLVAKPAIRALTGQPLEEYREEFTVSGTCDLVPNTLSGLASTAGDVTATIRFLTTKPSTTEVRFGVAGGELDCLGGPCPVLGAPTTTANAVHTVGLSGLTVNVGYDFAVTAEDEVGSVATARGSFRTSPLPKVAVNEALADTVAGRTDDEGEFVELHSFEPADGVDLTGWSLRVTKLAAGSTPSSCPLPQPAPVLAPGAFLVLADTSFDGAIYGGLDEAVVLRFAGFCGLQNEPLLIELVDPAGRPISAMTTPSPRVGQSLERLSPELPDDVASFCSSRSDVGPTPGRENGVTGRGCE